MATSQDPLVQAGTNAANQILTPTNTTPANSPITPENLSPQTSVQVPTPQPAPIPQTQNIADQILQQSAVPDTDTQKQAANLSEEIANTAPELAGQSAALITAQNNAGLPQLQQQLQGISNQIASKQAELNVDDASLLALNKSTENQPGVATFIVQKQEAKNAADAAIVRAQKVAEIGVLNAQAQAAQGNISLAMQTAQQAVDAKYAPIKDQINTYQAQLQAIQPLLDADEKKQSDAQQLKVNIALQNLADQKQQDKDNLATILQSGLTNKYINDNGTIIRASDGHAFSSSDEFLKDAGVTSFNDAYNRGLIGTIDPQKIAESGQVANLATKYPDAGIKLSDSLDTASAKLQNSALYRKDTYIAGNAGIPTDPQGNSAPDVVNALLGQNPTTWTVQQWETARSAFVQEFGEPAASSYFDSTIKQPTATQNSVNKPGIISNAWNGIKNFFSNI
jgi:hypothetical protein